MALQLELLTWRRSGTSDRLDGGSNQVVRVAYLQLYDRRHVLSLLDNVGRFTK